MKVLLAGASGFLGRALLSDLAEHGHETTRLVRGEPAGPDEIRWDPSSGVLDASLKALAGEGTEGRFELVQDVFQLAHRSQPTVAR